MHPSSLSLDDVRALAQLLHEFDLAELELSRPSGERIRLRRGGQPGPAPAHRGAAAPVLPVHREEEPAVTPGPGQEPLYITSPFVGTFYRAPGPDASPFVEEGQRVRKGQALCIIEAMKLMNELEAEFDCIILSCLVENGRAVEYGQRLFSVRRCD
jgi:acetyl-CoA carboxylase biotin carboxyl carrier protein